MNLSIQPLCMDTWKDFEQLAQKHNGVWGGCWCTNFHPKSPLPRKSSESNHAYKQQLVEEGKAHAALVFDGAVCVAWCQFGRTAELPHIYHKKEVESKMTPPDWRITCFFVDNDYRKKGVSLFALQGALELIQAGGGGIVESYPQDTRGEKVSSSFLYNGIRRIFEQAGFQYEAQAGKNHCIMRITI